MYISLIDFQWTSTETKGKFGWVVRYVIIFQHVHFWIRLAAVSYRGKAPFTQGSVPPLNDQKNG